MVTFIYTLLVTTHFLNIIILIKTFFVQFPDNEVVIISLCHNV